MILDSSFLIDVLQGDEAAVETLDDLTAKDVPLEVSTLTVMEVEVGLSGTTADTFDRTMQELSPVPFDRSMARSAARLQRDLRESGRQIGTLDAMIAATSLSRDGVVVTRNVGEFERVDGITVESY